MANLENPPDDRGTWLQWLEATCKEIADEHPELCATTTGRMSEIACGPHRTSGRRRRVWVKFRPLGIVSENNTMADRQLLADWSHRMNWVHWGLEVGSWTLEIAIAGKRAQRATWQRRHFSQLGSDWDNEIDRICVGETTLPHCEIKQIRQLECHIIISRVR